MAAHPGRGGGMVPGAAWDVGNGTGGTECAAGRWCVGGREKGDQLQYTGMELVAGLASPAHHRWLIAVGSSSFSHHHRWLIAVY